MHACSFLGHSKEEAEFFLLLVLKARAGTTKLRAHFQEQIERMLASRQALANYLKLPVERVTEILDFLEKVGLVERKGEGFQHSKRLVHLGNDSENIVKHHLNWRLRCMRQVEERGARETHYSAAVSLSRKDAERIKRLLVDQLKQNLEIIGASPEEAAYGYTLDFFELRA